MLRVERYRYVALNNGIHIIIGLHFMSPCIFIVSVYNYLGKRLRDADVDDLNRCTTLARCVRAHFAILT